jgi:hypothetical protein
MKLVVLRPVCLTILLVSCAESGLIATGVVQPVLAQVQGAVRPSKPAWQLAQSSYQQGVAAYNSKRYNEAASLMYESIHSEEAGANAWLYMANSYFALGQKNKAEETYQGITARFPNTPQCTMAAQALQRMGGSTASSVAAGRSTVSSAVDSRIKDMVDSVAGGAGKPLRERVTIVKPVMGHDPVSRQTIRIVQNCFSKIPPKVQAILAKNNIDFVITPTMIDKYPEGAYQEVRGYEGGTSKSCPGLFDDHTVVIAQATVEEGSNEVKRPIPADQIEGTFLHEVGHALDACLDWYSTSNEFRHNYYLDIAHVPDDVAPKISYYLQKSHAGQIESCAELTSLLLGNERRHAAELRQYFPLTLAYIKKKLGL